MIANFNDHAANEHTFLAWVRKAMALVGFGLAIGYIRGAAGTPFTGLVLAAGPCWRSALPRRRRGCCSGR